MYKVNSTYTLVDFCGSKPVDCPECGGIGKVLSDDEKAAILVKTEIAAPLKVVELPRVDKRSKQYKELKKSKGA